MLLASAFSIDERSRLRRSHNQEGVLSNCAESAQFDNTRKNAEKAAGVSKQKHDESAIVQEIRHTPRDIL